MHLGTRFVDWMERKIHKNWTLWCYSNGTLYWTLILIIPHVWYNGFVLAFSAVDCGFEPRLGQSKDWNWCLLLQTCLPLRFWRKAHNFLGYLTPLRLLSISLRFGKFAVFAESFRFRPVILLRFRILEH